MQQHLEQHRVLLLIKSRKLFHLIYLELVQKIHNQQISQLVLLVEHLVLQLLFLQQTLIAPSVAQRFTLLALVLV